ncbi:MAG: hypothetical protein U5L10_03105 [Candidatus Moranbacteria bacterium]|nr:hypothetical protein [Candidatus Moranbacteria bacterium]
MKAWDYIRYDLWPLVKVRGTYWWWIVKYRGKKNIPPEVVFQQMSKSLARSEESLEEALKAMPEDSDKEEVKNVREALGRLGSLKDEAEDFERKNKK